MQSTTSIDYNKYAIKRKLIQIERYNMLQQGFLIPLILGELEAISLVSPYLNTERYPVPVLESRTAMEDDWTNQLNVCRTLINYIDHYSTPEWVRNFDELVAVTELMARSSYIPPEERLEVAKLFAITNGYNDRHTVDVLHPYYSLAFTCSDDVIGNISALPYSVDTYNADIAAAQTIGELVSVNERRLAAFLFRSTTTVGFVEENEEKALYSRIHMYTPPKPNLTIYIDIDYRYRPESTANLNALKEDGYNVALMNDPYSLPARDAVDKFIVVAHHPSGTDEYFTAYTRNAKVFQLPAYNGDNSDE